VPFEAYASRRIGGAVLSGVETLSEKQAQIAARSQARRDRARSLALDGPADAADAAPLDPLRRLADIAVGVALGVMLDGATVYVSGDPSDATGTPYDRLEMAQLRARLRHLVDQLPEQERRVLHHHYYQHVPFEEIAREAGLTKGRISQIHHAALRRLRQLGTADGNVLLVT
jgi:RNA polymerase sigma factor for flagellar operon FliA